MPLPSLRYEWLGGLASVAIADAVAGSVMLVGAAALMVITCARYGGLVGIDLATFPKPQFYQVPTAAAQALLWGFAASGFSFVTLPHFLQRVCASASRGRAPASSLQRSSPPAGEPGFEDLVASISTDIRPRAVLDEWQRLGVVEVDDAGLVRLVVGAFVPARGFDEKAHYFGRNLHDHLAAGDSPS